MEEVLTLPSNLFCPMELRHSWFLSEFNSVFLFCAVETQRNVLIQTPLSLSLSRPGNLKRGTTSLAEESMMKRSRTSSISSGSGVHAPRGTPGTKRNPIFSSYSSSLGFNQVTLKARLGSDEGGRHASALLFFYRVLGSRLGKLLGQVWFHPKCLQERRLKLKQQ